MMNATILRWKVKEERRLRKLTQAALASWLGMSFSAYVKFEHGKLRVTKLDTARRLYVFLGLDPRLSEIVG